MSVCVANQYPLRTSPMISSAVLPVGMSPAADNWDLYHSLMRFSTRRMMRDLPLAEVGGVEVRKAMSFAGSSEAGHEMPKLLLGSCAAMTMRAYAWSQYLTRSWRVCCVRERRLARSWAKVGKDGEEKRKATRSEGDDLE